jgi:hypothetical protein
MTGVVSRWLLLPSLLAALACAPSADSTRDAALPDGAIDAPGLDVVDDSPAALDAPVDVPATRVVNGVVTGSGQILTNRYDNARTGANLDEQVITSGNVDRLTLIDHWTVDGEIYAQVLVAPGADADSRALAIVATMQDSLYAFDVDAPAGAGPVWHLGDKGELGRPAFSARNIGGNNGILSTPVIDPTSRLIYLVARGCDPAFPPEAPRCEHRLFSVALDTGAIAHQVAIGGGTSALDDGGVGQSIPFDPNAHWNRPALLLAKGQLFVAFGPGPNGDQHEEDALYHGWVFAYDTADLDRSPRVYCTTPRGRAAGIWQGGAGPAADEESLYFTTSNAILASMPRPPTDWPKQPVDQEQSIVRLPLDGAFPKLGDPVAHYWDPRPYKDDGNVFQYMESNDVELGSSGPTLVPGTRTLVVGSKSGTLYVTDRDTMTTTQEPLSAFRSLPLQPGHTLYIHGWWGIPPIYQAPVFWRPQAGVGAATPAPYGLVFAWASADKLMSFRFDYGTRRLEEPQTADVPAIPLGGNLVLSADHGRPDTAVLWATTASTSSPAPAGHLWAFDPTTLKRLWRADTPAFSKFTPPAVARGRVLVPSTASGRTGPQQVLVYGLIAN